MRPPSDVDPGEFDSLNHEFYQADPAEVIERRLWMLVQYLGSDALEAVWAAEDLALARDEVPLQDERVRFAGLESMLIAHQAAETFLRLCLAHWQDAPCPWWELTRLRQPRVFPAAVSRISETLDSDATIAELLRLVSWTGDESVMAASGSWRDDDGWERHREGLRALVAYCCELTLDGADLYNAGKHGLAILPGDDAITLGDGKVIAARGPSLTVIERTEIDGEPRWAKATHWVEYQSTIAMTTLIASAVQSLWHCGMQRRVGGAHQEKVTVFDSEVVDRARMLNADEGVITQVVSSILFDRTHPLFAQK